MRIVTVIPLLLAGLLQLPAQAPAATRTDATPPGPLSLRGRSGLKKVDLNSAPKETLVFMLKIPEDLAAKIIAARPFRTKAQLLTQGLVSAEAYASLRHKVVVNRPKLP